MNKVEKYYDHDAGPQVEWERLEKHRTEFAITMRALSDYLPKPPVSILDIGGGPGRYAIALTQQGYSVTLLDLSQRNIELAESKAREAGIKLAGLIHGNALDLIQFQEASFDAAVLMGPLYHLLTAEEREKAVREALRVLKIGGLIFAAVITRSAPIRFWARYDPTSIIESPELFEAWLTTGVHRAASEKGFTDAYFAHHAELTPLMEKCGFETLDLTSCEGVISMIDEKINTLAGRAWDAWVELNYRLGRDAAMHGTAEHLLYVGRKK